MFDDSVQLRQGAIKAAFSLGCFGGGGGGVLHPPIVQIYPPISVSEAAASPIRVMAFKAGCIQ